MKSNKEYERPQEIPCDLSDRQAVWEAIHQLSDIRSGYSVFDENEVIKYRACSLGIKALREMIGE